VMAKQKRATIGIIVLALVYWSAVPGVLIVYPELEGAAVSWRITLIHLAMIGAIWLAVLIKKEVTRWR